MTEIADYCQYCHVIFEKMGSCPKPDVSILYSFISMVPYLLIFYLIGKALWTRKLSDILLAGMLVSSYLFTDKILKNILAGERPAFSCKRNYGMPSSHMTVMGAFSSAYFFNPETSNIARVLHLCLVIVLGVARI